MMAKGKHARSSRGFYIHSSCVATILEPSNTERGTKSHKTFHSSLASEVSSYPEDLDTLTRAADAENFSYLLGDELADVVDQSLPADGERDGVCMTAPIKNMNTVSG